MPIEKVDGVWAETGTREPTLTAAKKTTGFVGGDQPEIERFNELIGRTDDKLDEIIEERVNTHYDGSADHQLAISTGIWPDAWAMGGEAANIISAGATKEIRDLAVFFTSAGYPRLLLLDNANTKIEVWDPRALSNTDTSDALTDDLPSGGGEVWECVSMATDGTSVYCTFKDTNATPDAHRLQAWDISTWNVKTGWAATGTALSGTGNGPLTSDCRDSKVIIADDDYIAVSCGWISVTAAGDAAIQLFDRSDGSAVRDGAGDANTGGTHQPCEDLVSDGTNIMFVTSTGTGVSLNTATIADLTVGTGGTAYPLSLGGASETHARLCMISSDTFISIASGGTPTASDNAILTHKASDGTMGILVLGQDGQGTPVSGAKILMNTDCYSTCFDGVDFWCFTNPGIKSTQNTALVKTDAGRLERCDTNFKRQWTDLAKMYLLANEETSPMYGGNYLKCVFDGRDIWANGDPRASQTHSGKVYRIPLAALRS
jgi:hypothetical protein